MEQQHHQSNPSVVAPLSMPKLKMPGDKAAAFNAFALSFAAFFGFVAIFSAIAGFTNGDWMFGIPIIGTFLSNVGLASVALITALMATAFGIIGLLTMKHITDKDALARAWVSVSKVALVFGIIYLVSMVAIALYSLMGVGKGSGVSQKNLWLSNFLPNLVTAVAAFAVYFFAKQIAAGKAALVRTFGFIAIGVASIGLILVVVQTLIGFYGKSTSSSKYGDDYSDIIDGLNGLNDLFNF